MNRKTLVFVLGALVALLALAGAAAAGYAALPGPAGTVAPAAPGRIELSQAEFDFGRVVNTGPVSHTFQVRNRGQGPLEILGVYTSCGCTTAAVDRRHLAPGESADLAVTFDPLAHDGALGQFMRVVYVRSDDPQTPEARLTIHVTVVEP